jgi:hypothetical protein
LICRDPRTLPAGGATEVEIARQLSAFGSKMTGLEQYAVAAFAEAMEVVPKTIAENSGAGCWRLRSKSPLLSPTNAPKLCALLGHERLVCS